MACERCQKKISTKKERVVCHGYCGASFHAVCVNVDGPLQEQLAQNGKNVFWMCDGCAGLFTNAHFRVMMTNFDGKASVLPEAFQSMRLQIEQLQSAVDALTTKVDEKSSTPTPFATPNLWPNRDRLNTPVNSTKRRRGQDGHTLGVPTVVGNVGTKAAGVIKTVQLNQRDDDNLLWIYLSAFHPLTSEGQIASLVSECLDLTSTSTKVVKLVPKGKDVNSLQFVSFKVGIAKQLKEKALSSDSWPENIQFREFDDLRSKNSRRIVSLLSIEDKPLTMETAESNSAT